MSLEEFCKVEQYHNLYAKYLWGFNMNRFKFIGITSNYHNSLKIFSNQFNIEIYPTKFQDINTKCKPRQRYSGKL